MSAGAAVAMEPVARPTQVECGGCGNMLQLEFATRAGSHFEIVDPCKRCIRKAVALVGGSRAAVAAAEEVAARPRPVERPVYRLVSIPLRKGETVEQAWRRQEGKCRECDEPLVDASSPGLDGYLCQAHADRHRAAVDERAQAEARKRARQNALRTGNCEICEDDFDHVGKGNVPNRCPDCKGKRTCGRCGKWKHLKRYAQICEDCRPDPLPPTITCPCGKVFDRPRGNVPTHCPECRPRHKKRKPRPKRTDPLQLQCRSCDQPFEAERKPGRPPSYCPRCKQARINGSNND